MGGDRSRARRSTTHVEAILAAAPGPIDRIFATHTHTDHSPATVALKARTGADRATAWRRATANGRTRPSSPDVTLHGGERIALGRRHDAAR